MLKTILQTRDRSAIGAARPLPAALRPSLRFLLRTWSRIPKAPGYLTRLVEGWGARLAVRPVKCRLSNGMGMTCDLSDHVQRQIYFRGAYEPIEAYLFGLLVRPGMVVIDAGANVGQYSLIAAGRVGGDGQVHAFEPVPSTFRRLERHVLDNGLVDTVRTNMAALWHRTENLTLRLSSDMVGNDGSYTIGTPRQVARSVTALGLSLDDYVTDNEVKHLDLMKIDVEGAEWFVLRGSSEVISHWRPTMFVEINRDACCTLGYEPQQIWEFLKPHGYSVWAIGQSAEMCRSLPSLKTVDRANVIFHVGDLPSSVTEGWTLKSVLRYHRRAPLVNKGVR